MNFLTHALSCLANYGYVMFVCALADEPDALDTPFVCHNITAALSLEILLLLSLFPFTLKWHQISRYSPPSISTDCLRFGSSVHAFPKQVSTLRTSSRHLQVPPSQDKVASFDSFVPASTSPTFHEQEIMERTLTAMIVAAIGLWIYTHTPPSEFNPHSPTEQTPNYEQWLESQKMHASHEISSVNKWAPMNIDRCVELHNEIFREGCKLSGLNVSAFETKNWFEVVAEYDNKARDLRPEDLRLKDVRPLLSKEVGQFLERVYANNDWTFAYWVEGMMPPERIANNLMNFKTGPGTYGKPKVRKKKGIARYLTLYGTSWGMVSHSEGLM